MGVDAGVFGRAEREAARAAWTETRAVVLFVGRLVEKKGVAVLLDAWSALGPGGRRGRVLWLVGDGTLRAALERQAATAGLGDSVRFFGALPNADLPQLYAAAQVCVVPSVVDRRGDTEGQGVVLIEAMAAGTPVVASQVGGVGEVVRDGVDGVLVAPGDVAALTAALRALLDAPAHAAALGRAGQARVRAEYDWPVIARRFLALYRELGVGGP